MKRQMKIMVIAFMALVATNCTRVPAGYMGLKVYLLGSNKGEVEVLGVGRHYAGWNEDIYTFPVSSQTKMWTREDTRDSDGNEEFSLQTRDGMTATADVGVQYRITNESTKLVPLFTKYRSTIHGGEFNTAVQTLLRARIRDAFNATCSKVNSEDLYGEKRVTIIEDAMKIVKGELENDGIFIEKLYWVNAIRLPQQIVEALNSKVQATQEAQKVENEIAKAKAQAEIRLVEARAKAQENSLKQGAMTQAVLMEKWIEKWDGKLPDVVSDRALIPMPRP